MQRTGIVLLLGLVALAAYAQAPASVEGTVTAVLMDRLQWKASDGSSHQAVLPADIVVTRRLTVAASDIRPGDWVGIDSVPGADGGQQSVAINVFSPKMVARVRKGQFTMASGDLMTNAPVDQITGEGSGTRLVLKNADAMVPFSITDATVIHRLVDGSSSDLKPGARVSIRGTVNPDGSVQAAFVSVLMP